MLDSITFFRVIKNGIKGFYRNLWLSAAATLVLVITLVIFSVLIILYGVTSYTVNTVKERVDISVYFKPSVTEPSIVKVKNELESNNLIRDIQYTSAEQALAEFKEAHKNEPVVISALEELTENPLQGTLHIRARDLKDYPAIAKEVGSDKYKAYVEKVNFEDNRKVIERLSQTLNFIVIGGVTLTLIFSIIAILVMFNTIALTIYNRREEIEIMRLVGATNWYIRGPFIVEALLYSSVATVITAIVFVPVFANVMPKILQYVDGGGALGPNAYTIDFGFTHFAFTNFWSLIALQLLISVVLTVISSLFAMRKHLKV